MKYLAFILATVSSVFFQNCSAQNDIASLSINGKTVGEVTITESPAVLNVEKAKYDNATKAVLNIKQSTVVAAYKRSISVTDENGNELYNSGESKSQAGSYNINITALRQKISEQKILKVFLLEDPLNEKMSVPSRKKLMVELHLK